jgi:DNA-binding transcriptional LysR family regulator
MVGAGQLRSKRFILIERNRFSDGLMTKRNLPPLNGLRAFETAARLGSFVAAAAELGVTPGAVSQLVRSLEARLGLVLFERKPQALAATRAALGLLPVLTEAFDSIDAAIRRARAPGAAAETPLGLACPAGFAALWLLPRLTRFARRAPEIALTLSATERLVEPGEAGAPEGGVDAAIRFGRAGWGVELGCDFLFGDRRIPVCSSAYLANHALATGSDPLFGQMLLEALSALEEWRDWMRWTSSPLEGTRRLSFGDERLVIDAALGGLGIALCDRALVAEPLAAGRLVAPLEPLEMVRGTAWFLVYRTPAAPATAALREWLLDECAPGR